MTVVAEQLQQAKNVQELSAALLLAQSHDLCLQIEDCLTILSLRRKVEWLLVNVVERLDSRVLVILGGLLSKVPLH